MNNIKTFEQLFEDEQQGPIVKFKRWTCSVQKEEYQNNDRISLDLQDVKTGEMVTVATVNVPEEDIEDDEVIIKTYGGNEGIVQALMKAKIISAPIRMIDIGYAKDGGAVCKLLI